MMKKITFSIGLMLCGAMAYAQNGLENIIVETYYISDANDTNANADGGVLPVGSVTYRIYADMLPGYKFQAAYGVNTPGAAHELRIATTTLFFNNEDRGNTTPSFTKTQARSNTVMLDSWLSVGAACTGNYGVMKTDDDGVSTNINSYVPLVLQNADPLAGIPLTQEDGFFAGTPEPLTAVGITTEIEMFNNQNDGTNGPVFSTWNGSWASLYGSMGPDSLSNKVLIAQITTDGVFSFKLNIQLGTPTPGGVENFVADSAVGNEIMLPFLTYPNASGINDLNTSKSLFLVYPNPVKDKLTLKIIPATKSNDNSYTIYNAQGKAVYHHNLETADKYLETVDVSSFTAGLYIIQLTCNGVTSSQKIIKN